MVKKLGEFSEAEITDAINQVPVYLAQWMKAMGIKPEPGSIEEPDLYEHVKKAIMKEWQAVRVEPEK